jgi:hypothetical protein
MLIPWGGGEALEDEQLCSLRRARLQFLVAVLIRSAENLPHKEIPILWRKTEWQKCIEKDG